VAQSGDAAGDRFHRRRIGARQKDEKLVPAVATEAIPLAQAPLDLAGHLAEHVVAGGVPQRVVHRLELVQVHQDGAELAVAAFGGTGGLLEPLHDGPAVQQTGERIIGGQMGQTPVGILQLGGPLVHLDGQLPGATPQEVGPPTVHSHDGGQGQRCDQRLEPGREPERRMDRDGEGGGLAPDARFVHRLEHQAQLAGGKVGVAQFGELADRQPVLLEPLEPGPVADTVAVAERQHGHLEDDRPLVPLQLQRPGEIEPAIGQIGRFHDEARRDGVGVVAVGVVLGQPVHGADPDLAVGVAEKAVLVGLVAGQAVLGRETLHPAVGADARHAAGGAHPDVVTPVFAEKVDMVRRQAGLVVEEPPASVAVHHGQAGVGTHPEAAHAVLENAVDVGLP